jgi:hypothetical protein
MRVSVHRAGAIAAALLLVAIPAGAQDEGTRVTFGDIGFTLPAELGASVNATVTTAGDPDAESFDPPMPAGTVFTFYEARDAGSRPPRIGGSPGGIHVYRTADMAEYDAASSQLEALRTILEERPDLTELTELPYLPRVNAAQVLVARPVYVDTDTVSGISYLAGFAQDLFPFTSDSLIALFQGISADGEWYVSAFQALDTSVLPEEVSQREIRQAVRRWDEYLAETIAAIDAAGPDAFTPDLTAFDSLAGSLTLGAVEPVEPEEPAAG